MSSEHDARVMNCVDAALRENSIIGMNTLLCKLSEDTELSQEFRYEQQMRLRHGVFNHGHDLRKRKEWEADQRRQQLTRGGIIV